MTDQGESPGRQVCDRSASNCGCDAQSNPRTDREYDCSAGQLQRCRGSFFYHVQRITFVPDGIAEVSPYGVARPDQILHDERLVETEVTSSRIPNFLRKSSAGRHVQEPGITGHPRKSEDDDGYADHHDHSSYQARCHEPTHRLWHPLSMIAGRTRARRPLVIARRSAHFGRMLLHVPAPRVDPEGPELCVYYRVSTTSE